VIHITLILINVFPIFETIRKIKVFEMHKEKTPKEKDRQAISNVKNTSYETACSMTYNMAYDVYFL